MDFLSIVVLNSKHQINVQEVGRSTVDLYVVDQVVKYRDRESFNILDNK